MTEFERIIEKMKERGIVPRIRYELMVLRALKAVGAVLIGAGIVWLVVK